MTPSSAATTSTTTSVAFAPRARIIVKASWPGVSRKTMGTCAARASSMASIVWGMTPSPAADDGLNRLGHDAVVGRDDEHDNVRGLRAARAHHREGFVAGRVEEDDGHVRGARELDGLNRLGHDAVAGRRRWPQSSGA